LQEYPPGRVTESGLAIRVHFTATLDSAPPALAATIRVDSVPELSGAGLPESTVDAAAGTEFRATLEADGTLTGFHAPQNAGPLVDQLANTFRALFPRLPTGGAASGRRWADTSTITSDVTGIAITNRSVSQSEAMEWTEYRGVRALRVTTTAQYTLTGTGKQAGQDITIEGTGSRHSEYFLGGSGRYLGAVAADTARFQATLGGSGVVLPVTQIRADSLEIGN
jgi:hypothetical protein